MVDYLPPFSEVFKDAPQIRVLTNLSSSKKFSANAYKKAKYILKELNTIKLIFQKENSCWAKKMANNFSKHIGECSIKEWFNGKASIPLHIIRRLALIANKQCVETISKNCDYFCTKTSNSARLPKIISPELAWLVAAILCDGHIGRNWRGVVFEVGDVELARRFSKCFSKAFELKLVSPVTIERKGRNKTYVVCFHNAPAELFLNKVFEIPYGYKCNRIIVPGIIKKASVEVKIGFLRGVFDTDGGKRGKGLGLTSLSEQFVQDVGNLLMDFGINSSLEYWINKRYRKKCFGLRFKIDAYSKFLMR